MTRHTLTNEWTEVAAAATAVTVQHLRGDRVQVVFAAVAPDRRLPASAGVFAVPAYGSSDFAPGAGLKAFARARGLRAVAEVTTAAEAPPEAVAVAEDGVAGAAFAPPVVADVAATTFSTRVLTVRRADGLLARARNLDLDRFRGALVVSALAEGATPLPVGSGAVLASGARLRVGADGAFTYDPRAAFAALAAGATETETVAFTVLNGGATSAATLTITVRGTGGGSIGRPSAFSSAFAGQFNRVL